MPRHPFRGVPHLTGAYSTPRISVMSKSVSVIVTDDLDGSDSAETVSFGFDGVTYEIDLAQKNRAKLEKALAPFIEAGRRVPRSGGRRAGGRQNASSADRGAVRAWARERGMKVSERGRVSADIMRQYEAAH
jgi:thiazole synthase ThiGH ThiG subunit